MANFVTNWKFYKHTYNKPYIVRVLFSVKVPAFCSLVADNMCRCDHWFSRNGNVRIKYDIVNDGNINRHREEIIKKSIVVDLNAPYSEHSIIELIVTNGDVMSDNFSMKISDASLDTLVNNL